MDNTNDNESLNSSTDDSRRQLYERFRADLAEDRRNLFYDEEDLLEVYDYATDIHDRFIALEVLFAAERLCPSSVPMAERKALFYLGYDDDAATAVLEQIPDDSFIKSLTMLRIRRPEPDEARRRLDELIDGRESLTDEEIIQLTDTAEELGVHGWLFERRNEISKLTDYTPTFLYELAQIARENDPDEAIKILDELTRMEPFSIDFWLLAAQTHIEHGHSDLALPAIEYALAIDPRNVRALLARAQAFNELDYPPEQTEAALREVIAVDPDIAPPYLAMAMHYAQHGQRFSEALEVLREYNALHPGLPQTLDIMLIVADSLTDENIDADIDSFLTPRMADFLDSFIDLARRNADEGRHRSAALLLLALERTYRLPSDFDLLMEELYRSGFYKEAIRAYSEHYKEPDGIVRISIDDITDCFTAFWFILSVIRTDDKESIKPLLTGLLASETIYNSRRSITEIFESQGLTTYLLKINAYLNGNDALTPDDLDPFVTTDTKE